MERAPTLVENRKSKIENQSDFLWRSLMLMPYDYSREALFDPVTELPNRRCFEEELARLFLPVRP